MARTPTAAAMSPVMLFGGKPKPAPKKAVKKAAPVKKTILKGPKAAQPGSNPVTLVKGFFGPDNWLYQAFTILQTLPEAKPKKR